MTQHHTLDRVKHGIFILLLILVGVGGAMLYTSHHKSNQTPSLPEPPLKDLAHQHQIELGNFAMPKLLGERHYSDILTQQFNVALIDNQPNWHFTDTDLRPSETTFNFNRIDQVVNYAQSHHLAIQAHHYVWGEEKWLPNWLIKGHYTPDQLLDLIHNHIATVGSRYSGKVEEWSVVNEAFSRNQHVNGLHDWWGDHIGSLDYIDKSFLWARKADPHSKLLLNDFGNENENSVSDAMYAYIKDARARGIPIDGIGMQMHIDGTHPPKKDEVKANMERFGALGVGVYVTEFDVNMNDVKAPDDKKDQIEADIYYDMMRACIESKVCHSFSFLGITDKETWYSYVGTTNSRPLLFDKEYQPKPAYYKLRQALEEK